MSNNLYKIDAKATGIIDLNLKHIEGIPVKGTPKGDGDALLWAGLVYSATDNPFVQYDIQQGVYRCVTEEGRIYRSLKRVNVDTEDSASRDMAMGFLLYCASSLDYRLFEKFNTYIKRNKRLCDKASDTRCTVTLPLWWAIICTARAGYMKHSAPWYASVTYFLYPVYLFFAALFVPKGYQMHLVGVHAYLRSINEHNTLASKILAYRQPDNPFFQVLAGNLGKASELLEFYIKEHEANKAKSADPLSQWRWERATDDANMKHGDSMEWDFVFMNSLIEKKKYS